MLQLLLEFSNYKNVLVMALFFGTLLVQYEIPNGFTLEPQLPNTLLSYLDQFFLGKHIWKETKIFDPEGILSTMGASLTALSGMLYGLSILKNNLKERIKNSALFLFIGFFLNFSGMSFSKPLWNLSFVLITSGLFGLAFLFWEEFPRIKILEIVGQHALFVFVFSGTIARLKFFSNFRTYVFSNLKSQMSPQLASLTFATLATLLFVLITLFYSWIRKSLEMRFNAFFRFSSKEDK